MNILRIRPKIKDLRKYLLEAISSEFGFSEKLGKYVLQNHFKDKSNIFDCDLSSLNLYTIKCILKKHELKPDWLYYIVDNEDRRLSDFGYFTGIHGLDLKLGLIVFEAYNLQIYYLLNKDGIFLDGPCHDLDLGPDGLMMYRYSKSPSEFQIQKYIDKDHFIDEVGLFEEGLDVEHLLENFPARCSFLKLNFTNNRYFEDSGINETNKNDREYVLNAVKYNGWSLQFAPSESQDDEEIVRTACLNCPEIFLFASERIRNNKEFVAEIIAKASAVRYSSNIYPYLPVSLKKDPDICELVNILSELEEFPISNTDNLLFNKRDLVLQLIRRNPTRFKGLPERFRNDYQITLAAVTGFSKNLDYCSARLRTFKRIANKAREAKADEDFLIDNKLPF